jgi:aldehyde:ferredoxin oxidoreductase
MRGITRKYAEKTGFPPDAVERVTQGPLGYNVARLTKWVEDFSYAMDGLGICTFPMYQRIDTRLWANLYTALTGLDLSPAELLRGGERGLNAKRAFNLREGATRDDDRAPPRFAEEAVAVAGGFRPPLGQETIDFLVDEYYEERGWILEGPIKREKREEMDVLF